MLTQIEVGSENPFFVPILGVTPKDSLLVMKIAGLGPVGPTLFIGNYSRNGGTYQGRRVGNRNPVFTFQLNPNPALGETIAGLRDLLYRAFMDPQVDGDFVKISLHHDDGKIWYLVGYTEKLEPDPFSEDIIVPISLICPDPFLRNSTPEYFTNSTGWSSLPVTYDGNAETGFQAEIYPTVASSQLTLDINGDTMVIASSFATDKAVYVSTVEDALAIKTALVSDIESVYTANPSWYPQQVWDELSTLGLSTSLVGGLSAESDWVQLHSISSVVKVYSAAAGDGKFALRRFIYREAYWGI